MTECPIVELKLGKIRGKVLNNVEGSRDVFRYSSLPFAKPPVGELRFQPPVEPDSWSGVLDGTKHSASPQQDLEPLKELRNFLPMPLNDISEELSEDCLYLSIYTSTTSKTANLPVLLWLYGGGFNYGSEGTYDSSVLASIHDVVVVVPNYRVSVFGFLSLGHDSEISGNYGLLDQLMAMKWTRNHIQNFGGNPNNITIFGESAGAISVDYHVLSPMSRGCFDKAISHSGSAFMGLFAEKTSDYALSLLLEQLKIEEKDPKKLAKILKSVPAEKIMDAVKNLREKMIMLTPSLDGKFITATMKQDKPNPVPYVVGMNNTEGCGILSVTMPKDFMKGIAKEVLIATLKGYIGELIYKGLPDSAYQLIIEEYSKGIPDDKMKWSNIYGNVAGDMMFVIPGMKSANHHLDSNNPTYMYVMSQATKFNHHSDHGPKTARKPAFCECDHGDDLMYTFGFPLYSGKLSFDVKFTEEEKELSREWMKYIANFAKTGDPNNGKSINVKWPVYDSKEQTYLSVQQPCSQGNKFAAGRIKFWKEVIAPMRKNS